MWGSWSLEPLQHFNTSIVLEQGLVLSCQNACISPFTASTNFIYLHGILPLNAHNLSISVLLCQDYIFIYNIFLEFLDVSLKFLMCI